ncbi:hypothetical protein L2E82_49937 [Cichorium intybus]|nr:hypothetical protein L2E82_49937 [Cichorium intybus]
MVSAVKTMGVIGIIMLFFVATTVGDEHPTIPCCDGEYTSCCKAGYDPNPTTYGKVFACMFVRPFASSVFLSGFHGLPASSQQRVLDYSRKLD